jgi:hypothetical protein
MTESKTDIVFHCTMHGPFNPRREVGCPFCVSELRTEIARCRAKLLELAGECAECGGTGQVQQGVDQAGQPAMYACDACFDIRALL